jgi:hypothetical protein
VSLTYPRLQTVDPQTPGFFHCVSRCVRRAFLCGQDVYSGRSYEHRKAWVEERLLALAECFAVGLYAYAVTSNHVHIVLHVDPQVANAWSDEEVAERWVRLFPVRADESIDEALCREKARRLQGDPERIAELRSRLGSLSWFMRCLNEPIARQANREDGAARRDKGGFVECEAVPDGGHAAGPYAFPANGGLLGAGGLEWPDRAKGEARHDCRGCAAGSE